MGRNQMAPCSGGIGFFFLEGDRDIRVCGQPHFLTLDLGNETEGNEVVMPSVGALAAVALGQLDSLSLNFVDSADMDAVGADHFHMFANSGCIGHYRVSI